MRKLIFFHVVISITLVLGENPEKPVTLEELKTTQFDLTDVLVPNKNGSPVFGILRQRSAWGTNQKSEKVFHRFVFGTCVAVQIAKSKTEWLWATAAHCIVPDDVLLKTGTTKSTGLMYTTELGWRETEYEVHPRYLDAVKKRRVLYDVGLIRIKGDPTKEGLAIKTTPTSDRWIQVGDMVKVSTHWNPGLHDGKVLGKFIFHLDESDPPADRLNPRFSEECTYVSYSTSKDFPGIKKGDSGAPLFLDGKLAAVLSFQDGTPNEYATEARYASNEAMDWLRDEWSVFTGEKRIIVQESSKPPYKLHKPVVQNQPIIEGVDRGITGEIKAGLTLGDSPSKWTALKITAVKAGSVADKAGLKVGDLVIAIDTYGYQTEEQFLDVLNQSKPKTLLVFKNSGFIDVKLP